MVIHIHRSCVSVLYREVVLYSEVNTKCVLYREVFLLCPSREQDDEEGANVEDSSHQQEEATPTDSTHLQEEAPPTDSTHNQEATPTDSAPSQQDEQLADQDPNSALEAEAAGSGQENEHQSGQESGHSSLPLETTEEGVPMKKPRGRRQKFKQPES